MSFLSQVVFTFHVVTSCSTVLYYGNMYVVLNGHVRLVLAAPGTFVGLLADLGAAEVHDDISNRILFVSQGHTGFL